MGQAGRTARALTSGQAAVSALAAGVLTTGQAAVSIEALIEVQGVRSDPMGQGTRWTEALTTGQAAQSGLVSSLRAPSLRAWLSWPSSRKERGFFLVPLFSVTGLCQTASLFGGLPRGGGARPKFSIIFFTQDLWDPTLLLHQVWARSALFRPSYRRN